jgi:class 3 adenylate cyclase
MARETKNKAVLFADITDSSALYQKLGDTKAQRIVNACVGTLRSVLPPFEGELVKTLGDAVMCVFPTADQAVLAAGEMQAVVTNSRPGNHPVAIHVGLHHGPVLLEGGDVFGDTVNVAAYLTAVATREQILTTEVTESALSPALKSSVRPVFHAVLKGSGRESVVYQVLWKTDRTEITQVNLQSNRVIPGDTGSLLVELEGERVRIDQWRPSIKIGRGPECDLVVADRYVSRQHLTIRVMRTRFYLIDHSINGTYVTLQGGEEVHVLRGEMPLDRSGMMCLGHSCAEHAGEVITFQYDRRSMYRI